MKRLCLLFSVFLALGAKSQTTCETAQPFCAGGVSGVYYPATTNAGSAQNGPYYGCLNTQPNPSWYFLQIGTSGSLDILIQGQTQTTPPGPGQDVDFICWGPFSSLANVCNSLTSSFTVDCSYSGSFTETLNIANGIAGEYYMVLITNFANVNQNILFTQFGGTGSTNCALVSKNYEICYGSNLTLTTSVPSDWGNLSYSISPGGAVSTNPSFTVTPQVNTSYTIIASGTNTSNIAVTQTAVANVTVNPQPALTPTVVNATCTSSVNSFNLGLIISPTSAASAYTVNWASTPNVVSSATQVSGTGGVNAGAYTATVVAAGGCSATGSFTINPVPATADFSFIPSSNIYSVTCYQPTLNIGTSNAGNSYTWANNVIAPMTDPTGTMNINGIGNWTVNAVNLTSGCVATRTLTVSHNTTVPTSVITPTFQNITCNLASITMVTITATPTVNVLNEIVSPLNIPFSLNSPTITYLPAGDGTYTSCVTDLVNGCQTCKTFTVMSSQGYPTFNAVSPQSFTLGCASKSFAIVSLVNGNTSNPVGGPVTYTALAPGASSVLPPGWNGGNTYTTTVPGTWTLVTKDLNTGCETRVPISIIANTVLPAISSVTVPQQILDCSVPSVTLDAISTTSNVSYNWSYSGGSSTPVNVLSNSVAVSVNLSKITTTLVGNYTLSITDHNNACINHSVIPMMQNIFPPKTLISSPTKSISCKNPTITLSNSSESGIPDGSGFINNLPAVGYLWEGPSPQTPLQLGSTYVAQVPGQYLLTSKDLNNGCTAQYTLDIGNDRNYPPVNSPKAPAPAVLDCGSALATVTAQVAGDESSFSYTWAAPESAVTGADLHSKIFRTPTVGVYKLVVLNNKNGCASSGQYTVENGKLDPGFEADQTSGFAPLTVNFTNTSRSTIDSSKIATVWSFGNGSTVTTKYAGTSPNTVYKLPGTYTVAMFAQKGNCVGKVTKTIVVDIPSELAIPNVFTPNGDQVNDLFFLKASNLVYISIVIYDRWGHQVYNLKSETGNIAWDGKNQYGKDVSDGTYFYLLKAVGKDEVPYERRGTITLIR